MNEPNMDMDANNVLQFSLFNKSSISFSAVVENPPHKPTVLNEHVSLFSFTDVHFKLYTVIN